MPKAGSLKRSIKLILSKKNRENKFPYQKREWINQCLSHKHEMIVKEYYEPLYVNAFYKVDGRRNFLKTSCQNWWNRRSECPKFIK